MTSTLPLHFDRDGLVPVVTQDAASGEVLMLAFMNEEAVRRTRETGLVHYWSRSRDTLWLKGETSGNRQQLVSLHINCDQNSLLLKVLQLGAVCHDGFDTCYYRSMQLDGTLQVDRDRVFDPRLVYGQHADAPGPSADPVGVQFGAYEYLRDHDLGEVSSTSRRLRAPDSSVRSRVSDELRELSAVLAGEHVHQDRRSDIILESSQVIYWAYVASIGAGLTWQQIRPDLALSTPDPGASEALLKQLLLQYASRWTNASEHNLLNGSLSHGTLALVAQCCLSAGVDPQSAVSYDLQELRGRPYLAEYFAAFATSLPGE